MSYTRHIAHRDSDGVIFGSTAYHVTTNHHRRETFDVVHNSELGWLKMQPTDSWDDASTGFEYRGEMYVTADFIVTGSDLKTLGFDGVMATSAWDAIVVSWFDSDGNFMDGEIVVGHIHW